MSFKEVQFPTGVTRHQTSGPQWSTDVKELDSGHTKRIGNWEEDRHRFDIARGDRIKSDIDSVIAFFLCRAGRAVGFRYKDWADFSATVENIGTGDGVEVNFQLRKAYASGSETYYRTITKIVAGTVHVYVVGAEQTEGAEFNLDYDTGLVTFTGGNEPGGGEVVTATFEFDVPVRFDADYLPVQLESLGVAKVSGGSQLIEVRITSTTTTSTTTTLTTSTTTTGTTTTGA